jgi:ZIP family zinc transporter
MNEGDGHVRAFFCRIDNLIPSAENPHEPHSEAETALLHDGSASFSASADPADPKRKSLVSAKDGHDLQHKKLMRTGLFTALAIARAWLT